MKFANGTRETFEVT